MSNVRSAVPTAVFEDACVTTTRVLGHKKKISVVFRGDQAYTTGDQVVLPSLPTTTRLDIEQQQVGAGYVDHETAHLLYTTRKDWEAALIANPDPLFKAIFNCLEDSRVETKMIEEYPGSRHHLVCCSDAVSQASIDGFPDMQANGQVSLRGIGPYSLSVGGSIRNGAAGHNTATFWGMVPEEIRDWADDKLDELAKCKNTKQTGELATRIYEEIKDPNAFNLPSPKPMAVQVPAPAGGKGKGKGRGGKKAKAEKPEAEEEGGKHEGDEAAAQEEGDDNKADGKPADDDADPVAGNAGDDDDDLKEDSEDDEGDPDGGSPGGADERGDGGGAAPALGEGDLDGGTPNRNGAGGHGSATPLVMPFMPDKDFKKLLGVEPDPAAYSIYTRENDHVIELRPGVTHHSVNLHVGLQNYNQLIMGGRAAVIRRRIERAMLSTQLTGWKDRQEDGRLDTRRLVNAYNGERDVFRTRTEARGFDTAVSLMIDRSGSMCGSEGWLAAEAAINLCLAVEQMGVAVEVCGFQDGEIHNELYGKADRIHGVDLVVFKPFDLTTSRCRVGLGAAAHAVDSGTPDGDGTVMAYLRLRKRPEKRKVLITLTDGGPGSQYGRANAGPRHHQFVRDVIAWIASEGTAVIGLGIKSDAVRKFYDKYVIINSADDIAGTPMTELARLLLGGRLPGDSTLIKQQNRLRA